MNIKKYEFWLPIAAGMQLLTGIFHTMGIMAGSQATNAEEEQMLQLMKNYKMDLGAGFHHSMYDIMTSFSIAFALLLYFAGMLNFYLWSKKPDRGLMRGIMLINLVIFGICFITMALLTFLPPIICCGLIVLFLLITWILLIREKHVDI